MNKKFPSYQNVAFGHHIYTAHEAAPPQKDDNTTNNTPFIT